MKTLPLFFLCLGLLVAIPVQADTHQGRSLAATCATCHGTNGYAQPGMKSLAGRPAHEIVQLVREFRAGQRPSTLMQQIAKGYTEAQIAQIAEFFAGQKNP